MPAPPPSGISPNLLALTDEEWSWLENQYGWNGRRSLAARDSYGSTPLMYACNGQEADTVFLQRLIEAGADVQAIEEEGMNLFWYCVDLSTLVPFFMTHGIDPNIQNSRGLSLLHVYAHDPGKTLALLRGGVDPELVDMDGLTAMAVAEHQGLGAGFASRVAQVQQEFLEHILPPSRQTGSSIPKGRL